MISPIVRIFFGLLFIASGVLKLFPVDYFELILVQSLGISWNWVALFARLIIMFEIGLGAMLVSGVALKTTVRIALVSLVLFSAHIALQIFTGEGQADCGCFGELLPMNAMQSLLKNVGFFVLGAYLLMTLEQAKKWSVPLNWLGYVLAGLAIPTVLIITPLPTIEPDADFELDFELVERQEYSVNPISNTGTQLSLILYAKCVHCAQLGNLLATIDPDKLNDQLSIVIVGTDDQIDFFLNATGIEPFNYARSKDRELIAALDGTFPGAVLMEDGVVTTKWTGSEVNIGLINRYILN